MPCVRSNAAAVSRLPLASSSARLHSMMPAPVRSRNCFTSAVDIRAVLLTARLRDGADSLRQTARVTPLAGGGTRAVRILLLATAHGRGGRGVAIFRLVTRHVAVIVCAAHVEFP